MAVAVYHEMKYVSKPTTGPALIEKNIPFLKVGATPLPPVHPWGPPLSVNQVSINLVKSSIL